MSLETAANEAADKRYPELTLAPENERLAEAYAEGFIAAVSRITPEQVAEVIRENRIVKIRGEDGYLSVADATAGDIAAAVTALYRGENGDDEGGQGDV